MSVARMAEDTDSESGLSSSPSRKSAETKKTTSLTTPSNTVWKTAVSPPPSIPGMVPNEPSAVSLQPETGGRSRRRASVDELMLKAKSGAAEAMRGLTMDPATALKQKRQRLQEDWAEPESIAKEMDSFEHGCGWRFVLKESSILRKSWSFIVALLLLYTGTVFPYKLAFIEFYIGGTEEQEKESEQAWMPVEMTVDILFWIDLFLIFLFSYKDEDIQVEVCDLKAIGCRYLKGFFFVNFLACVPPSWFSVLFGSSGDSDSSSSLNKSLRLSRLHRTSRLARLARLGRLAKLAPFLHESATWKYIQGFRGVRMMNLTVGLMWVVHLMACGWYLCAALHENPDDTWVARRSVSNQDGDVLMGKDPAEQWVHALYFILTIFTTVGFGDMSAFTTAETLYVDWAMIVGTVVNSIIMSEVITTLTGVDRAQAELNKRYGLIKEFSEHARLSGKVTTAFEKAVQRASHAGEMRIDPSLMKSFFASDTLPRELMLDLTKDLFQGTLIRNELLVTVENHGIPLSSRLPLILAAHPKQYGFQDVVYQNADQPVHIYLVLKGTLAFVGTPHAKGGISPYTVSEVQSALGLGRRRAETDDEEEKGNGAHQQDLYPYKLFGVRSYLGEYEPFADLPARVAYARVESELGAEVLVLHKKDLLELKGDFPAAAQIWIRVARRKEWHRGQLLEQLTEKRNYKKLALHTIQSFYRKRFGKHMAKERTRPPGINAIAVPPSTPTQTRQPSVSQEPNNGELQKLRGKVEVMDQRMLEIQQTLDIIMEEMRASRT